jgi:aminobenzoyl-glutamate utilization protein B
VRANSHEDVEYYFRWVADIARGAAIMTRTEVKTVVETDCHELIPNTPLADLLFKNMNLINAPQFTDDERAFARKLQKPLEEQFQKRFAEALEEKIRPLADSSGLTKGSTDVGDISWRVPTSGIRTTCFPSESPGHSWQNVACVASTIGEKGMLYAAQVLAIAAIDLLEDPKPIEAAKADLKRRLDGRQYSSLIPQGQKAPARIR